MKRLGFILLLVAAAALIMSASGRRGGEEEEEELELFLLGCRQQHPSSSSLVLNGDLVEKIWLICLQDIAGTEEILSNGQSFASGDLSENDLKTRLFLELLALLPPEKKYIALECISANYFDLDVPQEDNGLLKTYLEYLLGSLLACNFSPRRHLATSMSPAYGAEARLPLSETETSFSNLHGDALAPKPHGLLHPPMLLSEEQSSNIKLVLITLVLTATFTSAVAFIIFRCCGCNKSKVSVGEQRDERPLLHLHLADFPGSSPESRVLAGSIHKDNHGDSMSFKTGLNISRCISCFQSGSNDTTTHEQVPGSTLEDITHTSDAPKSKPPPPPPLHPPKKKKRLLLPLLHYLIQKPDLIVLLKVLSREFLSRHLLGQIIRENWPLQSSLVKKVKLK